MVSRGEIRDSGPHIRNYAGTFVAQYRRESIWWVTAYDGVIVAMAGARASYVDANLARLLWSWIDSGPSRSTSSIDNGAFSSRSNAAFMPASYYVT